MKKIGLTGGIASGKSTSLKIIIKSGFKVIDSDKIVKKILNEDDEVAKYIKHEFGEHFVQDNRVLNDIFGDYIFTYKSERLKYENFIMPKILYEINEQFLFYEKNNERVCILDAPILIEKNLHKDMDYIVLIWTNRTEQLKRLMLRDKIDEDSAIKRINAQMNIDDKKKFADIIIDNSKGEEYLQEQIEHLCVFLNTL